MTIENEIFNVLFFKHLRSTLSWRCEPVIHISFPGTQDDFEVKEFEAMDEPYFIYPGGKESS